MIFQNPVDGPRIVPLNEDRLPTDVLPNGHPGFRVTQTFGSTEGYYKGVAHGAVDIGNFNCGDRALAACAGNARSFRDSAGAIGVRIQHSSGWVFEIWHLNATLIPYDRWVPVAVGQQIGVIGKTGLGAICHGHLEAKKDGQRYDIWPMLAQNQEASVVTFGGAEMKPFFARAKTKAEARFRTEPSTKVDYHTEYAYATAVAIHAEVVGEEVAGSTKWYAAWGYANGRYRLGFFHVITLYDIEEIVDGAALQNRINRAVTVLEGVINAVEAGLVTLREAIKSLKG